MKTAQKVRYNHLTLEERVEIYRLVNEEKTVIDIAQIIGRNKGTVSRELKRNKSRCDIPYTPTKAHELSIRREKKQRSKAPLKNHETYLYVRDKLRTENWSPEMIAGRLSVDRPHLSIVFETIYQYIYHKGKRHKLWKYLPLRHKKRRVKSGRSVRKDASKSKMPGAVSILERPDKINKRKQEGHIETDLMEGVRSERQVLSVEVFRKSRYTQLSQLPNKKAETKKKIVTKKLKMIQSLEKSNRPIIKSVTADNGTENTCHQDISKTFKIKFYLCQPYHSWEKGTVENTIGRIRRYIPKGTPLSQFNEKQIQWLENKLNNTPRKCLKFKTPNEAFQAEVNSYKFRKFKKLKESIRCTSS